MTYEPMVDFNYNYSLVEYSRIEMNYELCFCWTRTSGKTLDLLQCVGSSGEIFEMDLNADETGVRPAMWILL